MVSKEIMEKTLNNLARAHIGMTDKMAWDLLRPYFMGKGIYKGIDDRAVSRAYVLLRTIAVSDEEVIRMGDSLRN